MPKRLAILGSTGSIGIQTLKIVEMFPDRFAVESLAAGTNLELLTQQIDLFHPRFVSVLERNACTELRNRFPRTRIGWGDDGVCEAAALINVDLVIAGVVGFAALRPLWAAIQAGKRVGLANKESMVVAGSLLNKEIARRGAQIIPVDSEHNAVFQLLQGIDRTQVSSIVLTASGGPLLRNRHISLNDVTPAIATKHPVWAMGPKISVDSATLMNKGLEIIEAHHLFDLPEDRIDVWVHPQSVLHGAVVMADNSVLAQLSQPDMCGPIAYALGFPDRLPGPVNRLTFRDLANLEFFEPDGDRFPALALARSALRSSPSHCIALNAANEVAVAAFLSHAISFAAIATIVE